MFHLKLLVFLLVLCSINAHKTSIKDNGYSDIVIAISPDVPNQHEELIINNIKSMFREASSVLYTATKQRAYFKHVRILIPNSWNQPSQQVTTWETFEEADVRVAPANGKFGDAPYTVQLGFCGEPGQYIHLTPGYLQNLNDPLNIKKYGPPGKVFVHEWSHLRYGVFDEYGYPGDRLYPLFYSDSDIKDQKPNMCANHPILFDTIDIANNGSCQLDDRTLLYDSNCRFKFRDEFKPSTSMMSYHYLPSVDHFCDEDTHNKNSWNRQNDMCQGRSIWSVIESHPDFANNMNSPNNIANLDPTFTIVRIEGQRFVLVADVSGSMAGSSVAQSLRRIQMLNLTARRWIKYDLPEGSQLGIVEFSNSGEIIINLMPVNDGTREQLMAKVPSHTLGSTCIGCGLNKGVDVLTRNNLRGGIIVLISDGEENVSPYVQQVIANIQEKGIRVVCIGLGPSASAKLETLADSTGGKMYSVQDGDTNGLSQIFMTFDTFQPAVSAENLVFLLFNEVYEGTVTSVKDSFKVDFTSGRDLLFRINCDEGNVDNIKLISPTGISYDKFTEDPGTFVSIIHVPSAENGTWNFDVNFRANSWKSFNIHVTAKMNPDVPAPIRTHCWVGGESEVDDLVNHPITIYASVKQGENAVIGAEVRALITGPNSATNSLDLLDNGSGGDLIENDGTYSRYFTNPNTIGRYTVQCQVKNGNGSYIDDGFIGSPIIVNDPNAPYCCGSQAPSSGSQTPTGEFNRIETTGGFKVTRLINNGEGYPPSKIRDLQVLSVDVELMKIQLKWTATGDDLDTGTADHYEIKYSSIPDELAEDNFDKPGNKELFTDQDVISGSLVPLKSGDTQTVTLSMVNASLDTTYFVALRAVDKSGKKSPVSNKAFLRLSVPVIQPPLPTIPPSTTPRPKETTMKPKLTTEKVQDSVNPDGDSNDNPHSDTGLIIGLVVGITLGVAAFGLSAFFIWKNLKINRQKPIIGGNGTA